MQVNNQWIDKMEITKLPPDQYNVVITINKLTWNELHRVLDGLAPEPLK